MLYPRELLLDLYGDPAVEEPTPGSPVTPEGKRYAGELERASWCLATGQSWDVWLRLTLLQRNAFIDAVNARNGRH